MTFFDVSVLEVDEIHANDDDDENNVIGDLRRTNSKRPQNKRYQFDPAFEHADAIQQKLRLNF